jgi:hypothetical protein
LDMEYFDSLLPEEQQKKTREELNQLKEEIT